MAADFRGFMRPPSHPWIAGIASLSAQEYAQQRVQHPVAQALFGEWLLRYHTTEFAGITTDGRILPGLFQLESEDAPVVEMARAADALLRAVNPRQKGHLCHPLDAREWRSWMNPELYLNRHGLRMDEVEEPVRVAILALLQASLSDTGFQQARDLMRINHFLGELVEAPRVMNEYSYNFNLFGDVSNSGPWGWNLYGHHLCLNCLVIGDQMVLTPAFRGAEPHYIDAGPWSGIRVFKEEEAQARALMRLLPPEIRGKVQLHRSKLESDLPAGRFVIADELMLCGAFQDNRIVPMEGAPAREFDSASRDALLSLIGVYLAHLPPGPYRARMRHIERHLADTFLCWIGGYDEDSVFYYRIQSPVLIIEFDHHAGVFLGNEHPERFHVHTIVRTPNGNDYGMQLVRQHCSCMRLQATKGKDGAQ